MAETILGILGGSGVYEIDGLEHTRWEKIQTPWGDPSDALFFGELAGQRMVFLPRHGRGHRRSPTTVNYRANIDAMKRAGVTDLIALSACGSLREDLPPGTFVIIDQLVDRTFDREKSFFSTGMVAHVSFAEPVCARLGDALERAAKDIGVPHHRRGTYMTMEGPQFSTLAESKLYRSWGMDVIGMTNAPEAKLAREAEMCFATVAMVTDFDCWHPDHAAVDVSSVIKVLLENAGHARSLVRSVAPRLRERPSACPHGCDRALDHALITAPEARDPKMLEKLDSICRRVLGEVNMPIKNRIKTIPDYPKPGIMFRDITSLLEDAQGFRKVIDELVYPFAGQRVDKVAGIEARGFILGGAVAHQLSVGFVPVRKKGKLPRETISESYALEYGTDEVEIHADAVKKGENILLIDDLIATGGTASAAARLITRLGGRIIGCSFVIDLPDLGGKKRLESMGLPVTTLVEFEGH